jgi:hypothetical protein
MMPSVYRITAVLIYPSAHGCSACLRAAAGTAHTFQTQATAHTGGVQQACRHIHDHYVCLQAYSAPPDVAMQHAQQVGPLKRDQFQDRLAHGSYDRNLRPCDHAQDQFT